MTNPELFPYELHLVEARNPQNPALLRAYSLIRETILDVDFDNILHLLARAALFTGVKRDTGSVDGIAVVTTYDQRGKKVPSAHLSFLCVDPAEHGKGIGSGLLGAAEAFTMGEGFDRIVLYPLSRLENPSGFYRSHGYRRVGTSDDLAKKLDDTAACSPESAFMHFGYTAASMRYNKKHGI